MKTQTWYLGKRDNPQFKKPYYIVYGVLTKKEVKSKEKCVYGSLKCIPFESESAMLAEVDKLTSEGFRADKRLI